MPLFQVALAGFVEYTRFPFSCRRDGLMSPFAQHVDLLDQYLIQPPKWHRFASQGAQVFALSFGVMLGLVAMVLHDNQISSPMVWQGLLVGCLGVPMMVGALRVAKENQEHDMNLSDELKTRVTKVLERWALNEPEHTQAFYRAIGRVQEGNIQSWWAERVLSLDEPSLVSSLSSENDMVYISPETPIEEEAGVEAFLSPDEMTAKKR